MGARLCGRVRVGSRVEKGCSWVFQTYELPGFAKIVTPVATGGTGGVWNFVVQKTANPLDAHVSEKGIG